MLFSRARLYPRAGNGLLASHTAFPVSPETGPRGPPHSPNRVDVVGVASPGSGAEEKTDKDRGDQRSRKAKSAAVLEARSAVSDESALSNVFRCHAALVSAARAPWVFRVAVSGVVSMGPGADEPPEVRFRGEDGVGRG